MSDKIAAEPVDLQEANAPGAAVGTPTDNIPADDDLLLQFFPDEAPSDSMPARQGEPSPIAEKPLPGDSDTPEPQAEEAPDLGIPDDVLGDPVELSREPATGEQAPEEPAPQFSDEKANHAFAQLRHERAEAVKRAEEAEKRLKDAESAVSPEQIQEYEQKISELETQLGQYSLASTKAFKQKYDVPLQGYLQKAVGMLVKAGAEQKEAAELVQSLRGKATLERAQELNDIAPALSGPIVNIFEDFDALLGTRETELRNWQESRQSIEREQQEIESGKVFKAADSLVSDVVAELKADRNPFYSESQNASWNEEVSKRVDTLRGLMKTGDPDAIGRLVAKGLAAEGFEKLFKNERASRLKYQEELKERSSLYPSPSQASGDGPAVSTKSKSDDQILNDIFDIR